MSQEKEEAKEQEPEVKSERPICPLCQSPLIGEAIRTGKCQCCGHRFDPEDL